MATHRYDVADYGETITSREFKRRYGSPFCGDGWYLLCLDPQGDAAKVAILAVKDDSRISTRGYFVDGEEEARRVMREAGASFQLREQEY